MKIFYFILFISINLFSQTPSGYELYRGVDANTLFEEGIHHNSIRHIKKFNNQLFIATSSGLGYLDISDPASPNYFNINNENLPAGGIPALKLYEINQEAAIFTSGITSTYESADEKYHHRGTGISWSLDSGNSWNYSPQPTDEGNIGSYESVDWYDKTFSKKVWHTTVDNVSYDIAADIGNSYVYAPLWGCGLKRLDYSNDESTWETIPLPLDTQDSLKCDDPFPSGYKYDPSTDGSGSYNHGVFSIFIDQNTIWVGTAGGINKGIINEDNCIDWYHYNDDDGLAGNWVVGIYSQEINGVNRIWAISWTQPNVPHSLSYTDDEGLSWNRVNQFEELGLIVYNLFLDDENVLLAATNNGVYQSYNGNFWEKKLIGSDSSTGEQLIYDKVLSAILFDVDSYVVGTSDGLAVSVDSGDNWDVIRSWNEAVGHNISSSFNAYPNPLYKNSNSSVFYSNGITRFIFSNPNQQACSIDIYDFAMDHVIQLSNYSIIGSQSEIIWDGKSSSNIDVSNGAYFCRLNLNDREFWTKVLVVN